MVNFSKKNKYVKLDDGVSFSLVRTNPKLTTNTKLMYNGKSMYMESYTSGALMNRMAYKNVSVKSNSTYNKDIANEIAKKEIMAKINYLTENPKYAIWFFSTKFISTWCEPTYQSIWSGPIDNTGELVNTKFLKSMYSSGTAFDVTVSICNIIVVNILFFALANNIIRFKNKSNNIYEILPLIFLIGGALFHLVWETKSQYVYVYILFLIPFAAKGLYDMQILVKNNKNILK